MRVITGSEIVQHLLVAHRYITVVKKRYSVSAQKNTIVTVTMLETHMSLVNVFQLYGRSSLESPSCFLSYFRHSFVCLYDRSSFLLRVIIGVGVVC